MSREMLIGPGPNTCLEHWKPQPCTVCAEHMRSAVAELVKRARETGVISMSWSFKVAAKSKTGALNKLSEVAKIQGGMPSAVAAIIAATIEALPDGKPVWVESSGHLDHSTGGNASFTVTPYIEVVD